MDFIPTEWIVKLATISIAAYEWSCQAWDTLLELWCGVVGAFSEKKYVIFEGSPHAYKLDAVHTWASGSAEPKWLYNQTRKEFVAWDRLENNKAYSLPYLSMEIMQGERIQYDLTDYIGELRVRSMAEERVYPTRMELLAAWTTGSYVVLHPTRYTVRVITEEGDTHEYTLDGERIVDTVEANEVIEEPTSDRKEDEGLLRSRGQPA
jgi:hypothetical protein